MSATAEMIGHGIDRRRYVSETEMKTVPFNSIVHLDDSATGTFIAPGLVLTCNHCIEGRDFINVVTTDGTDFTGSKFQSTVQAEHLDAGLVSTDGFDVPYLDISPEESVGTPVKLAGYGGLKVLTNDELKIVKKVYQQVLHNLKQKNEDITGINLMIEVELELRKYACKTDTQKDCVHCAYPQCIFNDGDNLKVQDDCHITGYDEQFMHVDCTASIGYSGAAILRRDDNKIVGIVSNGIPTIGVNKNADIRVARPKYYYDGVQKMRDIALQAVKK